ncbi:MAG: glycosyltransferase family 4 protein [Armatimonadetes bacterium]|nr:glycosyltransferase family 4 protein [Anaerolineae bacterium]
MSQNRIRVLSVTKSTGGLMHYNTALVKRMNQTRFDVHVVCLSESNERYAEELRALGVGATPMEMERYAISIAGDFRLANQLVRFIREQKFDVVIGHGSKAGFLVRWAERQTGVPSVYALATLAIATRIHGQKAQVYKLLERFGAALGGSIVTVAHSTRNELIANGIIAPERVTAILTGIDLEKFSNRTERDAACRALGLDPTRPVVGWAARLAPQKAPLDFVRAAVEIIRAVPSVQIYMAGEGELSAQTDALIAELGLQSNIIRASWQTDVPKMLSAFDIYVLSSHWEGLPLSVLEAMAMGCATVATSVDGTPEVIEHGVNGYMMAAGDTASLAQHVITLLQDPLHRRQVAEAGRQRVETHFAADRMVREWEAYLVKTVQAANK